MSAPRLGFALLLLLAGLASGCRRGSDRQFIRGAWLAEYGGKDLASAEARDALQRMQGLGVHWLAVGLEVQQPDIQAPTLVYGERDEFWRQYLRRARGLGLHLMLVPRIESPAFFKPPFPFRADIKMTSRSDWDAFFNNYEAMIVHYAELARQEQVELFCIGLEYRQCIKADPQRWRKMARAVRQVYPGRITYSANWWKEYEEVSFWDAVDLIGIGAYFEVAQEPRAGLAALKAGWAGVSEKLEALSARTHKPILFTETGYPGYADAGRYPWKWQFNTDRRLDLQHQADCFEALFESLASQRWFAGLFIWRFYTDQSTPPDWEYTPEDKPAAQVIRRWYRQH